MTPQIEQAFDRPPIRDTWPPLLWIVCAAVIAVGALMFAPVPY
jgi:hypothetical protein